jgi:MFS family permease
MNLASNLGFATFVLFAQEKLGLGDRGYGVLLAAAAVGSVIGGLVGARLGAAFGARRALTACILVEGLTLGGIGLSSSSIAVVGLMGASGLAGVVWNVITVSLRQRIIPDHLLGRVNSVYRFLGWGAIPVGALAGGFLANAFGLRTPWLVAGALTIVAAAVALPVLRTVDAVMADARAPDPAPTG